MACRDNPLQAILLLTAEMESERLSRVEDASMPSFVEQINKSWKSMTVIGVIIGGSIGGWNYTMAAAAEEAEKTAKIIVREEVKQVAREEVQRALDESKKQYEAQKEEAADLAAEKMFLKLKREGKLK